MIEVILDSYRYPEHRQLAEELCRQLNARNIKSRDGRRIIIRVRASPRE